MNDDRAHRAVRVWMREVMKIKGWTAAEWARRAGTSPTNITRVLSPAGRIIPKASTISLLAAAAGTQPQLTGLANMQPATLLVPLFTAEEVAALCPERLWMEVMRGTLNGRCVHAGPDIEGPAFALDVEGNGMEGRGLYPGDKVLVQKNGNPAAGDIIVAISAGKVVIGEWGLRSLNFRPPASLAGSAQFRPLSERDLHVIGQAVSLLRSL